MSQAVDLAIERSSDPECLPVGTERSSSGSRNCCPLLAVIVLARFASEGSNGTSDRIGRGDDADVGGGY